MEALLLNYVGNKYLLVRLLMFDLALGIKVILVYNSLLENFAFNLEIS